MAVSEAHSPTAAEGQTDMLWSLNEEDQLSSLGGWLQRQAELAAGRVGPLGCPAYWPLCQLSGRLEPSSITLGCGGGLSAYQHRRLLAENPQPLYNSTLTMISKQIMRRRRNQDHGLHLYLVICRVKTI